LLAGGQLIFLFAISKRVLPAAFIYLPTLIYFVIGFRPWGIDGSYRLFSIVFVIAAAWLVLRRRRDTRAILIAAVLCGLSSFFVQTRGLLGIGAIGLYLLWENWSSSDFDPRQLFRVWTLAGAAFLLTVLATQFYMAWLGGFENYYFANFTFLKDYYGADTLSNTRAYFTDIPDLGSYLAMYGTLGGLFRFARVVGPTLFIYLLVPRVYIVYFVYRKRRSIDRETDKNLMFMAILGMVLYIGASAPTGFRLYHISIPAMIVFVWLLTQTPAGSTVARIGTFGLLLVGVLYCLQRQAVDRVTLELPAGEAAFLATNMAEKYSWLASETKPGDFIYEAQHPTYYFPMHLKNPTPFYLVRDNNYTPPFQVDRLVAALTSTPPRLVAWHGGWSKEAAERAPGDNLAPLWDFIRRNYHLKKEFLEVGEFTVNSRRDIEFWERNLTGTSDSQTDIQSGN
jgi:hypothetical protein